MSPANRRSLTKAYIDRAEPQPKPYRVWDVRQRGLVLMVRPTGRKIYYVGYRIRRRLCWYRLADADAIALDDARKLAQRVMYEVAQGVDPQATRMAERNAGSFDDLHDCYLEYAKVKNRSWMQADKLVRRFLGPVWGKLPAADIRRSDVKAIMRQIESPSLGNQVLAAASAVFSWAIREEVAGITANPCKGVARNSMVARDRILSDAEVKQFWEAFDRAGLIRSTALKVLLLTGQRPGEVAHMRREHIVDGWWEMPGAPDDKLGWPGTKNGQSHRVWLPKPVIRLLAEMEDSGGYFFQGDRGGGVKGMAAAMRDVIHVLGVPRATPHDLRRTHGSAITRLGFGRDAMNRIQNHVEGGIADVYDRFNYADENKRVMEAVAAHLMSLATGQRSSNVAEFRRLQA